MKKVYVAGPNPLNGGAENARKHLEAILELINLGFAPYTPLLDHVIQDLTWVRACDCVLRLPGKSQEADVKVMVATDLGRPIYHSVDELVLAQFEEKVG